MAGPRPLVRVTRSWHLFDGRDQIVGRMASRIAPLLIGKHKPTYLPTQDAGDCVVVVNCEKVVFTGKKEQQKKYFRHSTYPGGMKLTPVAQVRERFPERILAHAVRGMLPKNRLRNQRMERLFLYAGPHHPHAAQLRPVPLKQSSTADPASGPAFEFVAGKGLSSISGADYAKRVSEGEARMQKELEAIRKKTLASAPAAAPVGKAAAGKKK